MSSAAADNYSHFLSLGSIIVVNGTFQGEKRKFALKFDSVMALVVILGGGESGYGSAVLAAAKGYDVLLSDSGKLKEPYRSLLVEKKIPFEEGGHTLERLLEAEFVVKSPGIPETAPVVRAIRAKHIPIISEIEFAGRYLVPHTRTVCITGSNGKTTTTTLIHDIMRGAGFRAELAGNIGRSFALQVAEKTGCGRLLKKKSWRKGRKRAF